MSELSKNRQAVRSIVANWMGYFLQGALALVVTPVIVHTLGNARYGIWTLVISVTGYYGLLNFGIRSSLTKYVAEYNARGDSGEVNRLVNSSFVFFLLISSAVAVAALIMSRCFISLFSIETIPVETARLLILITGFNVALSFLLQPFDAILVSLNRFDLMNIIGVTSSLVRAAFMVGILKCGYGLTGMALVVMCVDLTTFTVIGFCAKSIYPKLRLGPGYINRKSMHKLFSFGAFNFLRHVSRIVLLRTDVIVIGFFLGPSLVAVYSIAESLQGIVSKIVRAVTRVILPLISSMHGMGQTREIKRILLFFPKFIMPVAIFIGIQFSLFGETFLSLWLGDGYRQSYVVFCLLMVPKMFMMSHDTMVQTIVGMGKNRFVGYLAFVEAILNIVLSLCLIKKMGIVGVALGTVIPITMTRGMVVPVYCCIVAEVRPIQYVRVVLLPAVMSMTLCGIASYLTVLIHKPAGYMGILLHVFFALAVFVGVFSQFVEAEIKDYIYGKISRKARKIIPTARVS